MPIAAQVEACAYCLCLFVKTHNRTMFCEAYCRKAFSRQGKKSWHPIARSRVELALSTAMVLTEDAIRVRRQVRRTKRPAAVFGWSVRDEEGVSYPLPGKTKRFSGKMSTDRFYRFDPVPELPVVGKNGWYRVYWHLPNGEVIETEQRIFITWAVRIAYEHFVRRDAKGMHPLVHYRHKRVARVGFPHGPVSPAGAVATPQPADEDRPVIEAELMEEPSPPRAVRPSRRRKP